MSDSVKPPETAMVSAPKSEAAEAFELMQRKARTFASSPLVPQHIRGANEKEGLANCYICLVLAEQMGENPLVVMQNIYIVHGKPGWSASYMIAKANASGIFKGVIRFKHTGAGPTRTCTATAVLKDTGEPIEVTMSMETAKAEGWTKNSKYTTMPDQMLAYRAATLLVRLYCPQVMLGYHTEDEIRDVEASLGTVDAEVEPTKVLDALKARVAEATPDAVIETKLAEGELDPLGAAIDDFKAAGGIPEELAEANKTTLAKMRESKGKAREIWASLFATETQLLAAAKSKTEPKDGKLFNDTQPPK